MLINRDPAPADVCIYCGSTEYAPGANARLTREHVIPLSIGGELTIARASCKRCQEEINTFEAPVLSEIFRPMKLQLGIKGRSRKGGPPSTVRHFVKGRARYVEPNDHPIPLALPRVEPPNMLTGLENPGAVALRGFWLALGPGVDDHSEIIGTTFRPHLLPFFRMLAKIGHGFAVASLGPGAFNPLLRPLITGDDLSASALLVGGSRREVPRGTGGLHELDLFTLPVKGAVFLLSRIRLFAPYGAPVYYVIVSTNLAAAPSTSSRSAS